MQDSRAVSYADYSRESDLYNREKLDQQRISFWSPPDCSSSDALPLPLRGEVPVGTEKGIVKPFWQTILQKYSLIEGISNGCEVANVGTKVPDVTLRIHAVASRGKS